MNIINVINEKIGSNTTKYLIWYSNLMIKRNNVKKEKYMESHHIFPSAIFKDSKAIVNLTFREHYLSHLFLALHIKTSIGINNRFFKKSIMPINRMQGLKKNQHQTIDCKPFSKTYDIAKKLYKDSCFGVNNSFYGKTHTEETRKKISIASSKHKHTLATKLKISETCKITSKDFKTFNNDIIEVRIKKDKVDHFLSNNLDYKPGLLVTQKRINSSLEYGNKIRGIKKPHLSGSKCHLYNTIPVHRPTSKHSLRIKSIEWIIWQQNGYIKGCYLTDEQKLNKSKLISSKNTGRKMDSIIINKINKDPEKIKKTADAHRGMKRTEQTKRNISASMKGKPANNIGKHYYFKINEDGSKKILTLSTTDIIPDGFSPGTGKLLKPKLNTPKILKNSKYEILSSTGFCDFDGFLQSQKKCLIIKTDNIEITVTPNHKFFINETNTIESKNLKIGDKIVSSFGEETILSIEKKTKFDIVYDPINVKNQDHSYFSNDLQSHNCIILDEIAHVQPRIQEAMYASMMPTISTGGKGIFMSTPNGDQDLFAQLWRGAQSKTNEFFPIFVPIEEIPDRDLAWQEKERNNLGDLKFRQEHLCEFLSSESLLINSLVLQNLRQKPPMFIDKGFSFWKEPDPRKTYLIGADVGQGLGQDFSTIQVFELESLEQIAEFRSNSLKEDAFYKAIKWIVSKVASYRHKESNRPPKIYWSYENNAIGATITVLYNNDEAFPQDEEIELISGPTKMGLNTSGKSKPEACRLLKNLMERTKGGLSVNSNQLIIELKNYIQKGSAYEAKYGSTDDLISALLIVMQIMKKLTDYEPDVFDKIYNNEQDFYNEVSDEFDDPIPFVM